jgi:serine/threonine-protein kinase
LREANSIQVGRQAEASRDESVAQTEAERRDALQAAARRSFESISNALRQTILEAATAARAGSNPRKGGWTLELGAATLSVSEIRNTSREPWRWEAPAFDVIAHASITLATPQNRYGYSGRSHSLWFCDAITEGRYQWYETAFMTSPLLARSSTQAPFALDPGEAAAKALWNGMAEYQLAWPFEPLIVGSLDEFIDRWACWLAVAAEGSMQHPSTLPERQPTNNFRRR